MRRALLIFLAILVVGAAAATAYLASPPTPPPGARLVIREGDTLTTVATRLARVGVVRSALLFRLRARVAGRDRRLLPGEYRFDAPLDVPALLELLASGGVHAEVTIPEGLTVRDVATVLERDGYGSAASFLCVADDPEFLLAAGVPGPQLEGYLFPDTYRLTPIMGPSEILGLMVRRFHERFDAERYRKTIARGMTVNEILTLASIVEKESGAASERPMIAGVFYNRLRLNMPLQSDPTVIYGIPAFDGDLTRADLARPSAYNTYQMTGLPPGPIANPGIASIDAVLAPADTQYLYFVSKNDGSHAFAATLVDHNRNVARYQKAAH